jgi:hypothetical protein
MLFMWTTENQLHRLRILVQMKASEQLLLLESFYFSSAAPAAGKSELPVCDYEVPSVLLLFMECS